jgi:tetratricopeptide (TPR) repeat protein
MPRLFVLILLSACAVNAETALTMPFANHSDSASLSWIGESIAETVHDALASEGVLALDREDRLEAFRRLSLRPGAELTLASTIKVGDALDASKVIYGFFEVIPGSNPGDRSKSSLRITAHILDLKRMTQSAAFSETGAMEELALLEERLGWRVLQSLSPNTAPPQEEFLKARPAVRIDAVENYIRGLLADPASQRRFFAQAARLDEHYSQPCFRLGKMYWEQDNYAAAASWLRRVTRSDPHYLEARYYLGLCRYFAGDFQAAQEAFQEVAAEMPLNEVFNDLGAAQSRRGDYSGAVATYRKALEGDDTDPDYHFNIGYDLLRLGRFEAAADSFRAVLDRDPEDSEATTFLGMALKQSGPRLGDARAQGRQRIKINYDEAAYRQLKAELAK